MSPVRFKPRIPASVRPKAHVLDRAATGIGPFRATFLYSITWIIKSGIQVMKILSCNCRSRWPRGLRRMCAAVWLLGLRVRIPLEAWLSVSCECCVFSDRGLCVGLITRPEESYRVWCASECDREAWIMRRPWPTGGCCAIRKNWVQIPYAINLSDVNSEVLFRSHVCSGFLITVGCI
jgi:hypothetical protein